MPGLGVGGGGAGALDFLRNNPQVPYMPSPVNQSSGATSRCRNVFVDLSSCVLNYIIMQRFTGVTCSLS